MMINGFNYLKIKFASPKMIRKWVSRFIYTLFSEDRYLFELKNRNIETKEPLVFEEKKEVSDILEKYRLLEYGSDLTEKQINKINKKKILVLKHPVGVIDTENLFLKDFYDKTQKFYNPRGIFSTVIFGPIDDFICDCKRKTLMTLKRFNKYCSSCGVEINYSLIRRYRFGYINLSIPILHNWYFFGSPNYLSLLLKIPPEELEQYIYFFVSKKNLEFFGKFIETGVKKRQLLSELKSYFSTEYNTLTKNKNLFEILKKGIKLNLVPNEIFYELLQRLNLKREIISERINLINFLKIDFDLFFILKNVRRIKILENFYLTKTRPEYIFLKRLVVLPAGYREILVDLTELNADGEPHNSEINFSYQKIIRLSNKIKENSREYKNFLPIVALSRSLQENIDFLIDATKIIKETELNKRPLTSLSAILGGKFGKFRQEILGKRVNFSARSVISVNPLLRLNQCGLPYLIAKNLFDSSIKAIFKEVLSKYVELIKRKKIKNKYTNKFDEKLLEIFECFFDENRVKNKNIEPNYLMEMTRLENYFLKRIPLVVFTILNVILKNKVVFLNRAPTLHRLGVEAFEPILVSSKTIQIHPLVCSSYNADFDGDQMSLHIPLTTLSKLEIQNLMVPSKSLISIATNNIQIKPTQDIIIGLYYLTLKNEFSVNKGLYFNSFNDAIYLYFNKKIFINTPIWIKIHIKNLNNFNMNVQKYKNKFLFLRTTIGRILFNKVLQKNIFN